MAGESLGATPNPATEKIGTLAAEWLSPQEAAAWLRVSTDLIYRICETDKTFPAVKVGGLIRIRRARLDRWLDNHHPTRQSTGKQITKLPPCSPETRAIASGPVGANGHGR